MGLLDRSIVTAYRKLKPPRGLHACFFIPHIRCVVLILSLYPMS
jgi:hypothetical protein